MKTTIYKLCEGYDDPCQNTVNDSRLCDKCQRKLNGDLNG